MCGNCENAVRGRFFVFSNFACETSNVKAEQVDCELEQRPDKTGFVLGGADKKVRRSMPHIKGAQQVADKDQALLVERGYCRSDKNRTLCA